jgi:hypothetical protein
MPAAERRKWAATPTPTPKILWLAVHHKGRYASQGLVTSPVTELTRDAAPRILYQDGAVSADTAFVAGHVIVITCCSAVTT